MQLVLICAVRPHLYSQPSPVQSDLTYPASPYLYSQPSPVQPDLTCAASPQLSSQPSPVQSVLTCAARPHLCSQPSPVQSALTCPVRPHLCSQPSAVQPTLTCAVSPRLSSQTSPVQSAPTCPASTLSELGSDPGLNWQLLTSQASNLRGAGRGTGPLSSLWAPKQGLPAEALDQVMARSPLSTAQDCLPPGLCTVTLQEPCKQQLRLASARRVGAMPI